MRYPLAAALLFMAFPIETRAATCIIKIYFSDATHMRPVGSFSTCPGQKGRQGKVSRFSETDVEQIVSNRIPDNGLPCEFLERGCKIFEPRPGASRRF